MINDKIPGLYIMHLMQAASVPVIVAGLNALDYQGRQIDRLRYEQEIIRNYSGNPFVDVDKLVGVAFSWRRENGD